jgi:hypothetical protein
MDVINFKPEACNLWTFKSKSPLSAGYLTKLNALVLKGKQ